MSKERRKAIRNTETSWQLDGESELYAITIPDPPKAGAATTVRLTLSNVLGPLDGVEFYVRVGDLERPADQGDLNFAKDWVQAHLVEELVSIDGEEMLRSEAQKPFEDETPWEATYDAELILPSGRNSIEIKIISQHPELLRSLVLGDWEIKVRK